MKISISEPTSRIILTESVMEDMKDILGYAKSIGIETIKNTASQLNIDLKFMLTWGASIGGLIGPMNDYINGQSPSISESSVYLLCIGAISIVFQKRKN